jgi:hypothetical protein
VEGEEQRDREHLASDSESAFAEGIEIEGLSVPLSSSQRARRGAMAGLAVAAILALLFWPNITSLWNTLPTAHLFIQATATAAGSGRSGIVVSGSGNRVSIVVIRSGQPPSDMCPVTPIQSANGWHEMHPDTFGTGDVWALILSSPQFVAGQDTTIVWRATGTGVFGVIAVDANGAQVSPKSGPDPHSGSNWQRPGDEWGTIFNFPRTGCWQLHVTRGANLSADLWLAVVSPP